MVHKRIKCASHALGDTLACIAACEHYCRTYRTSIDLDVTAWLRPYLQPCYPMMNLVDIESPDLVIDYLFDMPVQAGFAFQLYGNPCSKDEFVWDFVDPKITTLKDRPNYSTKYYSFSIHSTAQIKYWNAGERHLQTSSPKWKELAGLMKKETGLNSVWIDKDYGFGTSPYFNELRHSPRLIGSDFDIVLHEIKHSEFYIGLSSGLSWVAKGLGKKTIMIAPWAEAKNEFGETNENHIRVEGRSECQHCWSRHALNFDKGNWYWCPEHEGTEREFECSASIEAMDVLAAIKHNNWI